MRWFFGLSLILPLSSFLTTSPAFVGPWMNRGGIYDPGLMNLGMMMIFLVVITAWMFCQCLLWAVDATREKNLGRERLMWLLVGVLGAMVFYEVFVFVMMFFDMRYVI